jgi:hypothetical protein
LIESAAPGRASDTTTIEFVSLNLSLDFRQHPLAEVIVEVLERHDHSRFETIGLSIGPDDDSEIRARIIKAVCADILKPPTLRCGSVIGAANRPHRLLSNQSIEHRHQFSWPSPHCSIKFAIPVVTYLGTTFESSPLSAIGRGGYVWLGCANRRCRTGRNVLVMARKRTNIRCPGIGRFRPLKWQRQG